MRRLSKSEIEQSKLRRQKQPDAEPPAVDGTATAPNRPAVPFQETVTSFRDSIVDYYTKMPHLRAFGHLRADEPTVADLLSSDAAALFEEVRQKNPDDPVALHHLAIIHHGRGYQLHLMGEKSPTAIRHWHDGVQAWASLVRSDNFWATLSSIWRKRWETARNDMLAERLLRVDLDSFRRQLPRHLLALHTGIVLESFQNDLEFAKEHMNVVLKSGFDTQVIEAARQRVYTKLLGDVRNLCKAMKFADARELVNRYLKIDSENLKALCDALFVCTAECTQEGKGNQNADHRLTRLAQDDSRAQQLTAHANQDWSVADALRDYYLQWADAQHDKAEGYGDVNTPARWKAFREAMRYAKLAVGYERAGDAAKRQVTRICWNGSIACENASADISLVRHLVDAALPVGGADAGVRAVNALYYHRKEQNAEFRRELAEAETLNAASGNPAVANLIAHLKQASEVGGASRRVVALLEQAVGAMRADEYSTALRHLNEIENYEQMLSPEDACGVHFLKTQCYLHQHSLSQARSSYRRTVSLMPPSMDPQLRNQILQLGALLG